MDEGSRLDSPLSANLEVVSNHFGDDGINFVLIQRLRFLGLNTLFLDK